MHFGVSARNGAPGVGSGRYRLGTGDRPYQGLEKGEYRARKAITREKVSKLNKWQKKKEKAMNVIARGMLSDLPGGKKVGSLRLSIADKQHTKYSELIERTLLISDMLYGDVIGSEKVERKYGTGIKYISKFV